MQVFVIYENKKLILINLKIKIWDFENLYYG